MRRREALLAAPALAIALVGGDTRAASNVPTPARAASVAAGEAALAAGYVDAAEQAFEQAASMGHAADAELGLARAQMQRGDYGRALALAAHTAGVHVDEPAGAALHGWLLFIGGQQAVAGRVIGAALEHHRNDSLLRQVQAQCRSGDPLARGRMLATPARLAPHGTMAGLPRTARVVGCATAIDGSRLALAPLAVVRRHRRLWLRDGLGKLAAATLQRQLPALGVALLDVARPFGPPSAPPLLLAAAQPAFPGSISYAARHALAVDAAPAWPLLVAGFVGQPLQGSSRELDGVPNGRSGGPVFDGQGRWIGISVESAAAGRPFLMQLQALQAALGAAPWGQAAPGPGARASNESVYQTALRTTLQLLA